MGIGLSLYTASEIARASVATVADALRGRVDRDSFDARAHAFARNVVQRARIDLEIVDIDKVPTDRAYVYMSNHQSHTDIPVLYATVPSKTLRMVAKKELFRFPVWGRAMRIAGMICVDRSNREAAIASLQEAGRQIADGVSIWIAPEGTRSKTGALGPFKKGGFHLASQTETPIVPIAIRGTHGILPSGTLHMAYDVPVRVTFGAPIPVAGRDIESLMDEVRGFLEANI